MYSYHVCFSEDQEETNAADDPMSKSFRDYKTGGYSPTYPYSRPIRSSNRVRLSHRKMRTIDDYCMRGNKFSLLIEISRS